MARAEGSANGDVSPEGDRRLSGLPGIEITRMAHEIRADLVVLGRRPRAPDRPLVLGETADAVLRRNETPTCTVPRTVRSSSGSRSRLDATDRSVEILRRGVEAVSAAAGATAIGVVTVDTEADARNEQRGPGEWAYVLRVQQLVESRDSGGRRSGRRRSRSRPAGARSSTRCWTRSAERRSSSW
ncbi:MAG: universal stress protein [Gemmatimonadales bacterium]